MSEGRVSQKQTEEDAGHSRKWIVNDSRPGIGAYARDLLDARRERDEARPIVEAAMRQYEAAAPCGWIGAWWLNPAFQTAAIQLHVTCEAAARAAAKENS